MSKRLYHSKLFQGLDTSPHAVDVMAALATMSRTNFSRAISGQHHIVCDFLAEHNVDFDAAKVKSLLPPLKRPSLTFTQARRWCSGVLLDTLTSRSPSSDLEVECMMPLVRLASQELVLHQLERFCDETDKARYLSGLARIMRHAAALMRLSTDDRSMMLARCLIGASVLSIPRWCCALLDGPINGLRLSTTDDDRLKQIPKTVNILDSSSFWNDCRSRWVDPVSPISASVFALWLRHFLSLSSFNAQTLDVLLPSKNENALLRILIAIVSQRVRSAAAMYDRCDGIPSCDSYIEDYLMHMVSEIAYESSSLLRHIRLAQEIRTLERHEIMLYSLGAYRDHSYHVVNVAAIGLLLDKCGLLHRGYKRLLKGPVLTKWLFASLAHDVGYVLAPRFQLWQDKNVERQSNVCSEVSNCIRDEMSSFLKKINDGIQHDLRLRTSLGDRFDHGIFSYRYLSAMIDNLPDKEIQAYRKNGLSESLAAIAKHNLTAEPISFVREPIAALLVLCDELQEWGRPRWDSEAFASDVSGWLHFRHHRVNGRYGVLCRAISVEPSENPMAIRRGKITLHYSDPAEEQYDPWAIVICKLYALQRLSSMPRIQVVMRFPVSTKWHKLMGNEEYYSFRDIMRRFVIERDYPVMRPEVLWPDETRSKSAVRWEVNEGCEDVIVELDKINEFRPVPTLSRSFFADFDRYMRVLLGRNGAGYPGMQYNS